LELASNRLFTFNVVKVLGVNKQNNALTLALALAPTITVPVVESTAEVGRGNCLQFESSEGRKGGI
jgi:hypothetical protein